MPEYRVRTRTSSGPTGASSSWTTSARRGAVNRTTDGMVLLSSLCGLESDWRGARDSHRTAAGVPGVGLALDGAGDEAGRHLLLQQHEEQDDRQDGDQGAGRERGDVDRPPAEEGVEPCGQ